MKIKDAVVLVTGANGGLGRVYVEELLKRGAAKVYAAARKPETLEEIVKLDSKRVVALLLDVTVAEQITAAVSVASDVTLLINNAGNAAFEGAIASESLAAARQEMEVNYFAPVAMAREFAPVLKMNGGGAILNMLSMLSLISLPLAATYSASKAAVLSVTRSIRAELGAQGTQVVGVLAVQVETAMGAKLPEPRMKPVEVVSDALDAIEAGTNGEVVAGAQSRGIHQNFMTNPEGLQAMMSTKLPAARAA